MPQRIIFSTKIQKAKYHTSAVRKQGIWMLKMDRHLKSSNTLRYICMEEWGSALQVYQKKHKEEKKSGKH